MHAPIAVFDAGIGSYAVVAEIQRQLPAQDILYFADRASFPYGTKNRDQLLDIMRRTVTLLDSYRPSAIVLASNAPSIMVLEELRAFCKVPIFGVFPPLKEALEISRSGHVGIMGVHSLIQSPALAAFIADNSRDGGKVARIDASALVELVENGAFLFSPDVVQATVGGFIDDVVQRAPQIDVLTLSSTHLPWLRSFFETARPACRFLDPAERIVARLGPGTPGRGEVRGLVTEDGTYDVASFRRMLARIGVDIPLETL